MGNILAFNKRHSFYSLLFAFALSIFFAANVNAQMDTVFVPGDVLPNEGNLNNAVHAAINTGTLSETVFKLESNRYYILTDSISVPEGEHLTIIAPKPGQTQESAPPQVMWSNSSVNTDVIFSCKGELTLKNIWVRYANVDGNQVSSHILIVDNPNQNIEEEASFEGVIFDYEPISPMAAGAVTVIADHFVGKFTNCYFKNCVDPHFQYYGRAVSFPYQSQDYHIDSLLFENCTFANIGMVFSQEPGNYSDYVGFNHCTFLNTVLYPLELGQWYWLAVTNCIFQNTFMLGHTPEGTEGNSFGGTVMIDSIQSFGFQVPFTESERHILFTNSSYFIEDWLTDWMYNNPESQWLRQQNRESEIPVPEPMMNQRTIAFFNSPDYPYINSFNLYDSTNPGFIQAPTDMDLIKQFLLGRWFTGDNINWAYNPEADFNHNWPMTEDLSYTNQELIIGGMSNFPLGDLYHWWPEYYDSWKAQVELENQNINSLLNGGSIIDTLIGIPTPFSPPFNAQDQSVDTLEIKWASATLATGYNFQLSLAPNFITTIVDDTTSDTTFTFTSLDYHTKYYWRVRAYNSYNTGAFSIVFSFSTEGAILSIPVLLLPTSNALDQPVELSLVSSKTEDATQYHWQVSIDPEFSTYVVNDSTSDTTNTVGPLASDTKFYWRVRGVSQVGESPFTEIDSFSTVKLIPSSPTLISPVAANDEARLTNFLWNSSLNATSYRLQLGLDSTLTSIVIDSITTDTSFTLQDPLDSLTTYYWRVRAHNIYGESPFSPTAYFTTGIVLDVIEPDILPKEFALSQNYPNPFNLTTNIKYSIPQSGYISLKVFNLLGQEVATLFEGYQTAGNYTATFDGSRVSSGVYLYRLKSYNFVATKKLMLLK